MPNLKIGRCCGEHSLGTELVRITTPTFVAKLRLDCSGTVVKAYPKSLEYLIGWDYHDVIVFCDRNGWKITMGG
jgi:hypothetical protein